MPKFNSHYCCSLFINVLEVKLGIQITFQDRFLVSNCHIFHLILKVIISEHNYDVIKH